MRPRLNKDHLIVIKDRSTMLDATLNIYTIPGDEVGPAHKKYAYSLSDRTEISYGWTKAEALKELLAVATERGWRVLQPLNDLEKP